MTDLVERLRAFPGIACAVEAADEIEKLRAVITRAKDALLDGQSTQWVHDLLVAALVGPK
jgi:dihydrodipicolinate synthase/N-acetylneuraminate lyase